MNEILIPTLLFWENGNTWYGSKGTARFFIQPVTPPQEEGQPAPVTVLQAELWRGPLTKQLSSILARASFPLSQDGLAQLERWLEDQAMALNLPQADDDPHS